MIEAPGEPLTVNGCGLPAGHCSVNAFTPALTGSLKPTVMSLPAPTPPVPLTGLVDVTAGAESVVKLKVWSAAGWSGASTVSVSLIRAARAVTVQVVPAGSAVVGVSVIVWPGEPLTVNGCCEDAGHASVNAFVPAVTLSLNVTAILASVATPTAPAAGWLPVTIGALSAATTESLSSDRQHLPRLET